MPKNIETTNKVIIQKMVQFPVDIAAEVLTCFCTSPNTQCALFGSNDNDDICPFADTHCRDITIDMWKEYLNG